MKIKKFNAIYSLAFLISTVTTTHLHAQPNLLIGQRLNQEERSKLTGAEIKIGDQSFKIITEQYGINNGKSSVSKTFVANKSDVIGVSENYVLISEIPTDQVRSRAKHIINMATSVKYYGHLKSSSLQFQTFKQAVTAYNDLVKLFPNAVIAVPIKFSEPSLR